ncbi:MAG: phenylalanine--tRNA ligase beta subunit-related protein [bacterium]|nr:phenylalanine--tRNA ligase beta subunit-related protein [bacterium]
MNFIVDQSVFELYPELRIGLVMARGVQNTYRDNSIAGLLRDAETGIRSGPYDFKTDPRVIAWMEAHKSFGSDPKRYAPSIYALIKRVAKGGELPSINPLVDLYNIVSLKYVVPIGGEDLDACVGDIRLTRAAGSEQFIELGKSEASPPETGEVVYRDDQGVLCRKFNWREAERTKLTEKTTNAVIVIETLPPVSFEALRETVEDLAQLIQTHCGGVVKHQILDNSTQQFSE